MKKQQKTLALWIVVILLMAFVIKVLEQSNVQRKRILYSNFIAAVETERVESVTFQGQNVIRGKFKPGYENGSEFELTGNTGDETFRILREHKIIPNYEREEKQGLVSTILINWFPMILLFVIFYFFLLVAVCMLVMVSVRSTITLATTLALSAAGAVSTTRAVRMSLLRTRSVTMRVCHAES